jgi:signal transduction histidine kinase
MLMIALPIAVGAALTIFLDNRPPDRGWAEILFDVGLLVGLPTLFGRIEFNRRRRIARDRDRAASDAVGDERARIARELHDVVAHAMSVMVVQAGAARTILDRDPAEAVSALKRIEDTGRMGLAEMRRLLGILDTDDDAAALVPQPGLERLDELLERMRGTGLLVEGMVEGTPRDLPPGIDLTAFRVVQEGLTNALRHAGAAHARVLLRYDDEALEVEVADNGRGPPPDGAQTPGHGLIGMRERVALFGGSLHTGTRSGGGFVVRARLPLVDSK